MKNQVGKKVNKEEEDFIKDLKSRNSALQKDNNSLQSKLKNASLTLQKYKQQLQSLKIRYGTGSSVRNKNSRENESVCKMTVDSTYTSTNQYDEDMKMVLSKLQERLIKSESRVKSLENENEQLKLGKAEMETHIHRKSVNLEERNDEASILRKQLHEATSNLETITVQYNSLESNAQIQLAIQKETRLKLEQCNSYILKLQSEIQVLRVENETISQTARKTEEQKEQLRDLIEENRILEDKLAQLCDLPFLVQGEHSSVDPLLEQNLAETEIKNTEYKAMIQKLEDEIKRYEKIVSTMGDENSRLKMKYEDLMYKLDTSSNMNDSKDKIIQTDVSSKEIKVKDTATQLTGEISVPIHSEISIQTEKSLSDFIEDSTDTSHQKDETFETPCPLTFNSVHVTLEYDEGKEEKDDESIQTEDDAMINLTSNNDLSYFVHNNDINYIDFLRFVDPPYPIIVKINNIAGVSTRLEKYLSHGSNKEDSISEESFVETVAMLGGDNIYLDDIHDLYRHIAIDGEDNNMKFKRLWYFFFSPGIKELRKIFLSFRTSSVNPWGPFKVADPERSGFVSKGVFKECLRSIGIERLAIP